jgi:hypothetical protein
VNPEYIEQQKREMAAWKAEVGRVLTGWYNEIVKFIPPNVNRMSVADLVEIGYTRALAKRLVQKKCLWLIRLNKASIAKIHVADLRCKYSYESQGLDIKEYAAIYCSLPSAFENDYNGGKLKFRTNLEAKLKELYSKFNISGKDLDCNATYKGIEGMYLDDSLRLTFDRSLDFDSVSDISSESFCEQEPDSLADIKRRLSSKLISQKESDNGSARVSSKQPAFNLESRIGNPMHEVSTGNTTSKSMSFLDELKARQSKL